MSRTSFAQLGPTDTQSLMVRWLDRIALGLTLVVAVCRTTLIEFLRDPFAVTPGSDAAARGPGPTTSLLLDALLILPVLLVLLSWAIDGRRRIGGRWLSGVIVLLAGCVVASAFRSDDRFSAAVDAANIVAGLATMWTVAQLTSSWKRVRFLAAVAAGVLMLCIAHGAIDRWVDLPARQDNFKRNLPDMLRQMQIDPNSFEAGRITTKINSGELLGFGASINTFAAVIVLCMVVAGGAAWQRYRDGDDPSVAVAVGLVIAAGGVVIVWTQCRAAYATPIMAAMCVITYGVASDWLAAHRRLVVSAAMASVAGVTAFLIHHGLATGTLFHDSLNFRWRYWVGAFAVWREQPMLGVGLDSFQTHYLAHRLPIASEEIKDPHNFIVHAFVEMGLIGGLITLAWIGVLLERMTRTAFAGVPQAVELLPSMSPRRSGASRDRDDEVVTFAQLSGVATYASVFAGGTLLAFVCATDWMRPDWNIAVNGIERLLLLCVGTLVACVVGLRSVRDPVLDDRPAPWIRAAMTAAVFVFVVHNLIDFAVFENSAMYIAAVVAGAAWGIGFDRRRCRLTDATDNAANPREVIDSPPTRWPRFGVVAVLATAWTAASFGLIVPTAIAESAASDGDDALRTSQFPQAIAAYESAAARWPGNPDYWFRAAMARAYGGNLNKSETLRDLDRAIVVGPNSVKYLMARARFELDTKAPANQTLADFAAALRLDPNAVDLRIEYADALVHFGQPRAAKAEYERALWFDDQLSPDEPKRLSKARIEEVRRQIAGL